MAKFYHMGPGNAQENPVNKRSCNYGDIPRRVPYCLLLLAILVYPYGHGYCRYIDLDPVLDMYIDMYVHK